MKTLSVLAVALCFPVGYIYAFGDSNASEACKKYRKDFEEDTYILKFLQDPFRPQGDVTVVRPGGNVTLKPNEIEPTIKSLTSNVNLQKSLITTNCPPLKAEEGWFSVVFDKALSISSLVVSGYSAYSLNNFYKASKKKSVR
ncbi:MAG: hypothetical protein LBT18_02975 [Endomicrobium sp.]|jgi:hypothetical protein|nr:hypothetical protein [Endomicrobium sp.]